MTTQDLREYKDACANILPHFSAFKKKLQEDLKSTVMNVDADEVHTIQIKFKYLSELEQLLNNEELNNG